MYLVFGKDEDKLFITTATLVNPVIMYGFVTFYLFWLRKKMAYKVLTFFAYFFAFVGVFFIVGGIGICIANFPIVSGVFSISAGFSLFLSSILGYEKRFNDNF